VSDIYFSSVPSIYKDNNQTPDENAELDLNEEQFTQQLQAHWDSAVLEFGRQFLSALLNKNTSLAAFYHALHVINNSTFCESVTIQSLLQPRKKTTQQTSQPTLNQASPSKPLASTAVKVRTRRSRSDIQHLQNQIFTVIEKNPSGLSAKEISLQLQQHSTPSMLSEINILNLLNKMQTEGLVKSSGLRPKIWRIAKHPHAIDRQVNVPHYSIRKKNIQEDTHENGFAYIEQESNPKVVNMGSTSSTQAPAKEKPFTQEQIKIATAALRDVFFAKN
jgi:hypothetical protein